MAANDSRAQHARRRKTRRRRAVAAAAGLAVVAGGGTAATAAMTDGAPRWQLETVGLASVTQTVESSGTISAARKSTPSFAVSGTVKSVGVKVGQSVRKGQVLARLDTTSVQADVDSATSTLASAKQKLEADKTGQTSAATGGSVTAAYDGPSSPTVRTAADTTTVSEPATTIATALATPAATTLDELVQKVTAAQNALIEAQKHVDSGQIAVDTARKPVDDDIEQNAALRDAQQKACAMADGSSDPSAGTSGSSTMSAACTSAMAHYEASATRLASDMTTLDDKIDAQDDAVKALDSAMTALDKLVAQLQSTASTSGSGSGSDSGGSSSGQTSTNKSTGGASTGSASGGTSSSGNQSGSGQATSEPASAAQLAADQAAIDAAEAQLAEANQNLAAATLTSPIAGKVAAIGLSVGGSASGTVTIVGAGVQKVSTTVPLADIDLIKTGEPVSVAADGVAGKLHGTVTSIGMLSTTSGSTTAFPVTVTLDSETSNLYDGTGADVVITTGTASHVTAVANSAIHTGVRGTHTVTVLRGGKTTTVQITLGVAGTDVTQVKSGLRVGDQVVLADLSQVLPTSTTSTTSRGGTFIPFSGGAGGPNVGPGGGR